MKATFYNFFIIVLFFFSSINSMDEKDRTRHIDLLTLNILVPFTRLLPHFFQTMSNNEQSAQTYEWDDNEQMHSFEEHRVDGSELECGFIAIGTSREEGTGRLIENAHVSEIRSLVAPDLLAFLMDDHADLPPLLSELQREFRDRHNSLVESIESTRQAINMSRDLLSRLNRDETLHYLQETNDQRAGQFAEDLGALEILNSRIDLFNVTITEEEFKAFIEYEFIRHRGHLSYIRGGGGTLQALASLLNVEVYIFTSNGRQLSPTFHFQPTNPDNTYFLHHTGQTDRGRIILNHFNLLHRVRPEDHSASASDSMGQPSAARAASPASSASLPAEPLIGFFDEDVLPTGHVLGPLMTFEEFDPINQRIKARFHSRKDENSFYIKQLELCRDPLLSMQLVKKHKFPVHETEQRVSGALNALFKEAERNEDYDAATELYAMAEESKTRAKDYEREWQVKRKEYYKQVLAWLKEKDFGEELYAAIVQKFHELRALKPHSLEPFLPLITFLSWSVDQDSLRHLLQTAKECDPYLMPALCLFHIMDAPVATRPFHESLISELKLLYPDDISIQAINTPGILELSEESVARINSVLTESLHSLLRGNVDQAISGFAQAKKYLNGFSFVHRYLALAHLLRGDTEKALQLFMRSANLLNHDGYAHVPKIYGQMIFEMEDHHEEFQGASTSPDALKELINLALRLEGQPSTVAQQLPLYIKFINVAYESMQKDIQQIPFVLLGIRWIASRLIISDSFRDYRNLFESLSDLMIMAANICFQFQEIDPWIARHFIPVSPHGTIESFIVKFDEVCFTDQNSLQVPGVTFTHKFNLASSSLRLLATALTSQIHGLAQSILVGPHLARHAFPDHKTPLPEDPSIFLSVLNLGLQNGIEREGQISPEYLQAVRWLDLYLSHEVPPYAIDPSLLEWAVFVVESCGFSDKTNIPKRFLLSEEKKAALSRLASLKKQLKIAEPSKKLSFPNMKALGQSIDALHRIETRSASRTLMSIPGNGDSIYEVFLSAQELFEWRLGESFEEWGHRLQALLSVIRPGFKSFLNSSASTEISSNITVESSMRSNKVRNLLRSIRNFWIRFHNETSEKNAFIQGGGDEDVSSKKQHNRNPDDIQKKLAEHERDVIELTAWFKKVSAAKLTEKEIVMLLTATLIINVQGGEKRTGNYHNIVVETREMAEQIYRILITVAADRLVRTELIRQGATGFALNSEESASKLINRALAPLVGAFHGPEVHSTGDAPRKPHYNAGIFDGSSLINVHIFFDTE